jgi:hypothetical protein
MNTFLKFVVLAGSGAPLTGYYLRALVDRGLSPAAVIVDDKTVTAKDMAIFLERTEGRLPALSYSIASRIPFFFVTDHNNSETKEIIRVKARRKSSSWEDNLASLILCRASVRKTCNHCSASFFGAKGDWFAVL